MKISRFKRLAAVVVFMIFMLNSFAVFGSSEEGWRQTIEIGGIFNDDGFISVNIKKNDNVSIGLQFMDNKNAEDRAALAMIRLTKAGKLVFESAGNWVSEENENNSAIQRADFEVGTEYNLKMNQNRETGLIEWFLNDEKIGETTTKYKERLCDQIWVMCTPENMNKISWTVNKPEKGVITKDDYKVDEEALAAEEKLFANSDDSADTNSVKLLTALGIMGTEEPSGKFWDNTPVKRREIAQILCNLFKVDATKDAQPMFNDVPEEYRGYVETVVRNGYMSGYGDGIFGANDYVTYEQLIKIFVSVLNGGNMAELSGGFPTGYIKVAHKLGISIPNGAANDGTARRIDVADMIYSALEADIMMLVSINDEYSTYETVKGYTFLSEVLDIYRYEGIMNMNQATALDKPDGAGDGLIKIGDGLYADPDGLSDEYLGSSVVAYVHQPDDNKVGNLVCIHNGMDNETLLIEKDDYNDVNGFKLEYYDGKRTKTVTLSPSVNMIYNGKAVEYDASRFDVNNGNIKLINNNNDGMFDVAVITDYEEFVVDKVNAAAKTISARFGKNAIDLDGNFCSIMRNGVPTELNKIGVGEVISAAISEGVSKKVIKLEVCSNRITDSVDAIYNAEDGRYISVAGNRYKIGDYCEKLIEGGNLPKISVGDEAQFFTDIYNNIVYFNVNRSGYKLGYLVRGTLENTGIGKNLKVTIYNDSSEFEELSAGNKIKINGTTKDVSSLGDDVKSKLSKAALVEYSKSDGVLTGINFAADTYDANEFSLDDSYKTRGTYIRCTATSVLDNKYSVTASTQVFIVPKGTTDVLNPAYYWVKTGSHFLGNWNYNTDLYDIDQNGEVRCAVIEQAPYTPSSINEGHSIVVVNELCDSLNDDGDIVPQIRAMAENGNEIVLTGTDAEQVQVTGSDETVRSLKKGDVIQYVTDRVGNLAAVKLIHDVDGAYHTPSAVEESKSNYTVTKAFGQVIRATASQIFISADGVWENMTPFDTDMLINNTGTAVYLCDTDRGILTKASFADADRGDDVFACVNTSNKTRMLVIYK